MSCELKEVIGVIHLPRLPSIHYKTEVSLSVLIEQAVNESKILDSLGYTGVIVENYGDYPYSKRVVDPLSIASMSIIVREVVRNTGFKVGVNLLRNSGREAYSIAIATGARFIRVNNLVETILSDSGILEPEAPRLKHLVLNHPGIEIYADILVKHAISPRTVLGLVESSCLILSRGAPEEYLRDLISEYIDRGRASSLIVTGLRTGEPPPLHLIRLVKKYSTIPVLVGSGVTAENIKTILREVDGVIVGSFIKRDGRAGNPLDLERAKILVQRVVSEFKIKR